MSVRGLQTPLQVLGALPHAMNWKDQWSPTEQYYQNDVVISPATGSPYILTGKTAILNGGDPSTNPDWYDIATAGGSGVSAVTAGTGISVSTTGGTATITNEGVRSITLNSVVPNGLVNTGSASLPLLNNAGVVTITPSGGVDITGGNQPTISLKVPRLTTFANNLIPAQYQSLYIEPGETEILDVFQPPNNLFNTYIQSGAPDPNGAFLLDLSCYGIQCINFPVGPLTIGNILVKLESGTGGPTYTPPLVATNQLNTTTGFPYQLALGQYLCPVADVRTALGGGPVTAILIQNNTDSATILGGTQKKLPVAVYYPYGLE